MQDKQKLSVKCLVLLIITCKMNNKFLVDEWIVVTKYLSKGVSDSRNHK